jgi:hypothetical protein
VAADIDFFNPNNTVLAADYCIFFALLVKICGPASHKGPRNPQTPQKYDVVSVSRMVRRSTETAN